VIAFSIDGLETYQVERGEYSARCVLGRIAQAVRELPAAIGVVASAYRSGPILLVAPGFDAPAAAELAERLRMMIAELRFANAESTATEHFTATVATVTEQLDTRAERIPLITEALSTLSEAVGAGGNRVVAVSDYHRPNGPRFRHSKMEPVPS